MLLLRSLSLTLRLFKPSQARVVRVAVVSSLLPNRCYRRAESGTASAISATTAINNWTPSLAVMGPIEMFIVALAMAKSGALMAMALLADPDSCKQTV